MVLLSISDVSQRIGVSRITLWRWTRDRDSNFPKPIRLGARKLAFVEDEINFWILENRWVSA